MHILDLNLDHYSGFELLYEEGFRFYTNHKNVEFNLKIKKSGGGIIYYQLRQGERDIFFFNIWLGYYLTFSKEFIETYDFNSLPQFIKNYHSGNGWDGDEIFDLITNDEILWLIEKLYILKLKLENFFENDMDYNLGYIKGDIDCISDLIIFLRYVKENDMELRISKY